MRVYANTEATVRAAVVVVVVVVVVVAAVVEKEEIVITPTKVRRGRLFYSYFFP